VRETGSLFWGARLTHRIQGTPLPPFWVQVSHLDFPFNDLIGPAVLTAESCDKVNFQSPSVHAQGWFVDPSGVHNIEFGVLVEGAELRYSLPDEFQPWRASNLG
jgi:hypothetical protein